MIRYTAVRCMAARPITLPPLTGKSLRSFLTSKTTVPLKQEISDNDGLFPTSSENQKEQPVKFEIPPRRQRKIVTSHDAVALIRNGDTVAASGFVCQGAAEAVLKALGERYQKTGSPNQLSLVFGGGPGDWGHRGLNHLAKTNHDRPMLKRTIGSHYGQVPKVAELALQNKVEAWTMPLGSISRMWRAQATHSPGHITNVGIGTYVDPDESGGAANEKAKQSSLELVSKINIDGQDNIMYKALPINVAIIRGTTADTQGNITVEEESLLCDQMNVAAAARNSGGIVIAQVKRLAADGSLNSKDVAIPSPLVDCIVVVDEQDHDEMHGMSYVERHNPGLTGQVKTPQDQVSKMPLSLRKVIARRSFFALKPNKIINLGIGLPEGIASVAAEEGMLQYITLSTEPGVFGGLPCQGHSFGPATNASAIVEMNQMFDFYDGGGLDACFLGAAQISPEGDVNVSRMSPDRLTGPGGFIDISQSTRNICFLSSFTAKGLEVELTGDGTIKIQQEGQVKKFVDKVFEKTFSGEQAVKRGQKVYYVTERAVFRRTAKNPVLELIEIAPGVDLQKDILDQMGFEPVVSPKLKTMDQRIFVDSKMNVLSDMFGSLVERCTYHADDHVMYLDLFGITLDNEEDIAWFFGRMRDILRPLCKDKGKIDVILNYDGFDLNKGLEDLHVAETNKLEKEFYKSVKRYAGGAFHRAQLAQQMDICEWDPDDVYDMFDTNKDGVVSLEELRQGVLDKFQIRMTPSQVSKFQNSREDCTIRRETFSKAVHELLSDHGRS